MTKKIKQIAEELDNIIYEHTRNIKYTNQKWEIKYNDLLRDLEYRLNQAKEVYESFKDDGLSLNTIEGEGYYRGLLTAYNLAKEYIEGEKDV